MVFQLTELFGAKGLGSPIRQIAWAAFQANWIAVEKLRVDCDSEDAMEDSRVQ